MSEYLNKVVYLTQQQYDTLKSGTAVGSETQIETNNIYVTDSVLGSSTDIAAIKTDLGLGDAAAKDIDTSISAGDTSTDVPTTAAVASFVEGKNYIGSTGSTGDLLYWSNTNTTAHLAAGTNGQVLTLSNGVPSWGSASGNQIVIIPVTFSSSTYSITYTYDELKALIVAGKIVVLSYNAEFYYQKHDNNIDNNSNPTLQFNSLNASSGVQYYFSLARGTTGAASISRNYNLVYNLPIIFDFHQFGEIDNGWFVNITDISELTDGHDKKQNILREYLPTQSQNYLYDQRDYFINKITYEEITDIESEYYNQTKANVEFIGIIKLNNEYVIRSILVSGVMYCYDDASIIVTVTDIPLSGGSSYSGVTTLTWDDTNKKITKTIDGTTTTDVVEFEAGSNVILTGSTGKLTIAATDTTYSSQQAASGGTTESLVTTGEKYTWNNKQDALVFNTAYNSSTNKVATMSDVGVTSVTTTWDDTNKKITQSINNGTASDILEFEAGSNITLTPASGKLTIAASNTDTEVTQTETNSDNKNYCILFSQTDVSTTRTEGARKSSGLYYNPYAKKILLSNGSSSGSLTATNYSGKAATAGTADSANSVALSNVSGASDLQAIEALTGTSGFLEKTAADTWQLSSITVPSASSTTPSDLGTAAAGSSTDYARADHVHKKPTLSDLGAADATTVVTGVSFDSTNKKIKETINSTASDVVEFVAGSNVTLTGASGSLTIAATDTTYSSETAVSDGTTVSLVTTGEKYTWNNKQEKMVILSYGSSTWQNFLDAYNNNAVIYCRASSNSNPASGAQTRLAFMAYINANPPTTEVEFQYYRSVNSHSATQMSDQVYVYKLNKTNGWSVTTREASLKQLSSGVGINVSYNSNAATVKTQLVSETALTNAATAATEVSGRVYPVAVDANGKLAVNVPWESGGSGDVVGPSSAVSGNVATFSGTTGKLVQDSGYTIATSVPANAVFTDTDTKVTQNYTNSAGNYPILLANTASSSQETNYVNKTNTLYYNPANSHFTAPHVKTEELKISDGTGEWVWTPTSTGLELTYVVYE